MFQEAKQQGLPEPEMSETGMRFRCTIWPKETLQTATEKLVSMGKREQVTEQVTEQVHRLLDALKNGPSGTQELMLRLNLKHRPTFVYDYLQPALDAGLTEMTQPKSPRVQSRNTGLHPLDKNSLMAYHNNREAIKGRHD